MKNPVETYEKRAKKFAELLHKHERTDRLISNLRLAVFITGVAGGATLYFYKQTVLSWLILLGFAVLFIFLIVRHTRISEKIKYAAALREINIDALKRLNGQWNTFSDIGEEFCNAGHSYSCDLDIFGHNSLYQWASAAKTYTGRQKLGALLAGGFGSSREICERQDAVKELAPLLIWRQNFLAQGILAAKAMRDPKDIIAWAGENNEIFRRPWVIVALRICPAVTVALIVLGFVLSLLPWFLPAIALMIQMALLAYKRKERARMFAISERYGTDLRAYYKMLQVFEGQDFKGQLLRRTGAGIRSSAGQSGYKQLNRLSKILDSLGNRRNMFYILINLALMWDFHIVIALEKWKQESGASLQDWFEALGEVEALASLAQIRFDNPDWAMPRISAAKEPVFAAREVGHPLLVGKRVHNDLTINQETKVLLITGSNMSGKSTLLRTAGINLVLAYAGAPVCAKSFHVSPMEIISCMRVSDDLSENVSSFYAELLRIKEIVEAVETGKRVFFLLDEVFKGTNSYDRHTGAKVLVNKLSETDSIGLVSTHDLELCNLERENPRIANFHFQEHYRDGKIYFDYRLRPGPSTTRNALYLMRLAGIEIE